MPEKTTIRQRSGRHCKDVLVQLQKSASEYRQGERLDIEVAGRSIKVYVEIPLSEHNPILYVAWLELAMKDFKVLLVSLGLTFLSLATVAVQGFITNDQGLLMAAGACFWIGMVMTFLSVYDLVGSVMDYIVQKLNTLFLP